MICERPISIPTGYAGCGSCMSCRFNLRRTWTARILMEQKTHEHSAFVTLTYRDSDLPANNSLDKKSTRYFLDRLRKQVGYGTFRFYLVGEYGTLSTRPHYHLALFGFPTCAYGETRRVDINDPRSPPRPDCCLSCSLIYGVWGKGNVFLGGLTEDSAQYVAGYVTEKLNKARDPRLHGRVPEFSSSSKQGVGGIGAGYAAEFASTFLKFNLEQSQADVPSALRFGSRMLPVGRHMKNKMREAIGREVGTPKIVQLKNSQEMRPLREIAKASPDGSLKKVVLDKNQGRVALARARRALYEKAKDKL